MIGSKYRVNRDMARHGWKKFSLDKVLTILSFVILIVVVVIPMVMIVYNTFFFEGKFDTSLFTEIIMDPANVTAMWNTIKIALLVTLFGTVVGLFFAWLLGRSDIPLKGLMRSMFTIPYMFPPFFGAMAWELLLSPRSGYLNKWLMATFHLSQAPFNINSIGGIIFVECSYYFPFVFMQVVSALERMDPTLEESARIAGAQAVVRHPADHHAAGAACHQRGRAADPDQLAVPLRRALHSGFQQENLHPAHPDLPAHFPGQRLVPGHP